MTKTSGRDLIDQVLDKDSFRSWDTPPIYGAISQSYAADLERARKKSGVDESVLTGQGTIDGISVAIIVSEFSFLGGSIGAATSRRLIDAIHRATKERLPLLLSPSSGGTRMQEGTPAFAMMISITTAVYRHKDAHLPFVVYLRNPTMGGVMASWGSAGHFTFAEPEAMLGFLGPRVVELTTDTPMPKGVQQGENLAAKGVIDGVISAEKLRFFVVKLMRVLTPAETRAPQRLETPGGGRSAWESIEITRDPARPGVRDVIEALGDNAVRLSGTGDGRVSEATAVAVAQIGGRPVMLIGQDRHSLPLGPAALRFARRGISLAKELDLPIISIIDTPGAELSAEAEEHGLAGSIARTLGELVDAPGPTVSIIMGQGCGGGALAMLPADRVLATENAWLSPLPPEGASAIIYRDVEHAPQMMEEQGVSATALLQSGIVDGIIAESSDFVGEILSAINNTLWELQSNPERVGREQRFKHYEQLAQS